MATKTKAKSKVQVKPQKAVEEKPKKSKNAVQAKTKTIATVKKSPEKVRVVNRISPPRVSSGDRMSRSTRIIPQYNYMKAPGTAHDFQVGDKVEVFCDHEKNRERVRGWIAGIVVQVDNKMVAVQFRSNVFLTDGWMVPDRILWYPLTSEHIRPIPGKKSAKKEAKAIPDY